MSAVSRSNEIDPHYYSNNLVTYRKLNANIYHINRGYVRCDWLWNPKIEMIEDEILDMMKKGLKPRKLSEPFRSRFSLKDYERAHAECKRLREELATYEAIERNEIHNEGSSCIVV